MSRFRVWQEMSSSRVLPRMFLSTSNDSFKIDELKLFPGICICYFSSNLFFTHPSEIFFDREEVFFRLFVLFENFAIELALVLCSSFYTDPAEWLCDLFF